MRSNAHNPFHSQYEQNTYLYILWLTELIIETEGSNKEDKRQQQQSIQSVFASKINNGAHFIFGYVPSGRILQR